MENLSHLANVVEERVQQVGPTKQILVPLETRSVFRGTWQPELCLKFGNGVRYLPVPPKVEPLRLREAVPVAVVYEVPVETVADRVRGPPKGVELLFSLTDRNREFRSCIGKDGTVYDCWGDVMGFVERETSEAGSSTEMYLGRIVENPFDNVFQAWGVDDEKEEHLIGYVDAGTATIRDSTGATVVDISSNGSVVHPNGTWLGCFERMRGFHDLKIIALYLMLLDPSFCGAD